MGGIIGVTETVTGSVPGARHNDEDPLLLQSSNNPGMILVSTPLNGNNYLTWSCSVKIALGAKMKLGFIDGKYAMPKQGSENFEKWNKVDCMVQSLILNSIAKDIVDAFLYAASAKELWQELEEGFGECNGSLLYHLQREISSISQGNQTVVQYYTKFKKLWDELQCLQLVPQCSCGAAQQCSNGAGCEVDLQWRNG